MVMLGWALTFLVVAIIAGVFGFGGIAAASAGIAQILFVVFLVLFAASLIAAIVAGRRPTGGLTASARRLADREIPASRWCRARSRSAPPRCRPIAARKS